MLVFLFFLVALLWGGSFIAIKIVINIAPPFWAAGIRIISAWIILYVAFKLLKKDFTVSPKLRSRVWLAGIFSQGLPFALLFWGEKTISPGLGGILNGTTPIWTYLFGFILLRKHESFTVKKLWGLALGIVGIFFIFGPKLAVGVSDSSTLGSIIVGIMAMSYGIGTVINRTIMVHPDHPTLEASLFSQTSISAVFVLALAFIFEGLPHLSWFNDPKFIMATLYMGWLSTAFAFVVYYKLINEWGAIRANSVAYLIPPAAVVLDFLFNKDFPSILDVIGMLILLAGILLLQGNIKLPFRRSLGQV